MWWSVTFAQEMKLVTLLHVCDKRWPCPASLPSRRGLYCSKHRGLITVFRMNRFEFIFGKLLWKRNLMKTLMKKPLIPGLLGQKESLMLFMKMWNQIYFFFSSSNNPTCNLFCVWHWRQSSVMIFWYPVFKSSSAWVELVNMDHR